MLKIFPGLQAEVVRNLTPMFLRCEKVAKSKIKLLSAVAQNLNIAIKIVLEVFHALIRWLFGGSSILNYFVP